MNEEINIMYADSDLSKYLKVLKVKRSIGNNRKISANDALEIGSTVQSVKIESKIIEVEFSLTSFDLSKIKFVDINEPQEISYGNLNKIREFVAGIFNQSTPQKLTFSDESDRYYLALVVDSSELEGIQTWYDKAKVTFFIPDGVAHSTSYKRVQNYTQDGNKLTFQIENNGNTPALPIITVKHKSENGYIGIANKNGVFALGSEEEEDGTIVNRNEVLFDYSKAIAASLEGAKNVAILNYNPPTFDTELKRSRTTNVDGSNISGEYVAIGKRGTTPGYVNHVGSLTWDIAPDSNGQYTINEHLWWSQWFTNNLQDRKGFIKLCVSGIRDDGTEEFLYGIETIKRKNGYEAEYNFMALDDDGIGWRFYKQFKFKADRSKLNPFSASRGRATEIFREEDKFRVFFDGKHHQVAVPSLKGKVSRKVHLAMGTFQDSNKYIGTMLFEKLRFEKMGVSHYNNIVNKYQPSDIVKIDFETDTVETKGVDSIQDMVLGSQPISIPAGKSELVIQLSSFVKELPEITIDFEERYL